MKKLTLLAIIIFFVFASKAQSNKDEIALIQSVYGMEKKDLIAKHMKIEASQSATFWTMYDEYEVARKEIGMKRANNIIAYADKYDKLTNENANALIIVSFEVNGEFVKLWEKTYKKMAKATSPIVAAQFIQAEMFLENMVRQELSMDIPLIGEFDSEK